MNGYIKDHKRVLTWISYMIKRIRDEKNIPQWAMARRMNISRQTYSKYENYPAEMTLEEFFKVADLLEVRAEDLLRERTGE